MRRFLMVAALLLSAFALNSCEEDVDGDASIYNLSIGDYNGEEKSAVEIAGVLTVTYDWLTATAVKGSDEIHLVALPNKTGKQRKLYVYGAIDNRSTDITVVQNK